VLDQLQRFGIKRLETGNPAVDPGPQRVLGPAPAGGEPRHVVKVQVFLTDITDRAKINPVRERYFGEHRPASTLVEVSALVDPRMKVEIEAVAVID